MILKFENWCISAPSLEEMMQYDNLSDRIIIDGSIPEDYSFWSLLVRVGGNENTISLAPVDGKLGVILNADMLAYGNVFYDFQLRGENGEKTKYTNVVTVYIPASLSGHGEWPELPSEFAQAEARLRDINAHPPIPGEDNEHWALWSYELQAYVLSDFPLPEGGGGSFNIHSLASEDDITEADELPFYDESAHGQRKTTWANIKAKLKAYFDSLFVAKVAGKGLSTNDYTNEDKEKVGTAIPEAPSDGKQYARKDGEWTEVTGGGGETDLSGVVACLNDIKSLLDKAYYKPEYADVLPTLKAQLAQHIEAITPQPEDPDIEQDGSTLIIRGGYTAAQVGSTLKLQ